jgi:hypothetical protein
MLKPAKGRPLSLWESCWSAIQSLRPAFSRQVSFMWFATVVAGLMVRPELRGVTSIIRALNLRPKLYDPLRKHFHSSAIKLDQLAALWTQAVLQLFLSPVRVNGRLVVVGDGIKVPKRGKKMPAVKLLHQQSNCSTKPEYIMGHSLQAVALLVNAASSVFAVPLAVRIHEGLVWSNRDQRTLLDKMLGLIHTLTITEPFYFVADAFYAAGKIVNGLLKQGNHLVSRVRSNAVAYLPPNRRRRAGRGADRSAMVRRSGSNLCCPMSSRWKSLSALSTASAASRSVIACATCCGARWGSLCASWPLFIQPGGRAC